MTQIQDKEFLLIPYDYEKHVTPTSELWARLIYSAGMGKLIRNKSLLAKFDKLNQMDKMASVFDAYNLSIHRNNHRRAAELAGAVFFYLVFYHPLEENERVSKSFYRGILLYGWSDMINHVIASAMELKKVHKVDKGLSLMADVRQEGIKELGNEFELIYMKHYDKQLNLEDGVQMPGWVKILIDGVFGVAVGFLVVYLINTFHLFHP